MKKVTRLYQQFQPEHYVLELAPDSDKMVFTGSVTIKGKKTGRPSQRLTFHQKGLKITSAIITKHDKKGDFDVPVGRINNQNTFDEVRLHTNSMVFPGSYSVKLEFEGSITRPMNGIYPCFFEHDGQEKKLIATQFESHHAREAFPCIDEPEAKATFDLTLITPSNIAVVANTPIKDQQAREKIQTTSFETTPKMSTYLLAFAYGELGFTEATTKDGVTVRCYATPDNVRLTDYGLQVAVKALEFFSEYFDVDYPLPKLDMIALPDFSSGAMENWGLVTYRETTMLADPKTSSIESMQLVALVIAHELSHQWFGNLVTMKWWDDLWLNESFANLMEYLAIDAIYPEWKIWEQFVSHESASAKRRDSLVDVQSIHCNVSHPDEISTLFDPAIVYAKGGSVLYMLLNHIGEAAFRNGLKAYFNKHRYGNTVADDLWDALSKASKLDISNFMKDWLRRPGYPLVSVDWQPSNPKLKLEQKRFLSDPLAETRNIEAWQVPLASTLALSQPLFKEHRAELTVSVPTFAPLLLNHDGQSYFLPHYREPKHLEQIVSALKDQLVDTTDRFLLLDNYILLQRGGVATTTELLELLRSYEQETSETVWGAMALSIGEARKLTEGDETSEALLDNIVQTLVTDIAQRLGWEDRLDDSAQTLRLRGLAISLAVGAKAPAFIKEGLRRFRDFSRADELPASTRTAIYFCGARHGTTADFEKLLETYRHTTNADEKDELASGLVSTREPKHYQQLIGLLTTDDIRRQDLLHWYVWLLRNRYSRNATWEWLKNHWGWIEDEFASDKSYSYFARYCGSIFSRQTELTDFKDFFGPKKTIIALSRDITLAEQEIASRVAWRERNQTNVTAWLASQH